MGEVLFVAGEPSGDAHAGAVATALRRLLPDRPLVGIGGGEMAAAGVELIEHIDRLAVMGVAEVIRHVPHHYRLLGQLRERLQSGRVSLVVLVDYPGFNMKVAAVARAAGVPVLYYITPQVWAWGAGRVARLARNVTRAAVILPFEESLLRTGGVDARFVGHPLLDRSATMPDRAAARAELGLDGEAPVLALFPGSRAQEVRRHVARFVGAARVLEARVPQLRVVVSAAPGVQLDTAQCPYPVVRARPFVVWRAADAALSKSGTSTLEAAVAGCPLVVAYRTSVWTYAIARRLVRIPRIGLVNVVAGRALAPELVQGALTPVAAAAALEPLLDRRSAARAAMLDGLSAVRDALGEPGASARVAALAAEMLG